MKSQQDAEASGKDLALDKSRYPEKDIQKELNWLEDPLKLADHVLQKLRAGEKEKVVQLVQLAAKRGIESTVAWNHLINYEMHQRRVNSALKIYNDVSF